MNELKIVFAAYGLLFSFPKTDIYTIQLDGGVVDPECGLEENAHVYSAMINNGKVYYSVILGLVDIERNKNSFYRMQLLESNDQNL